MVWLIIDSASSIDELDRFIQLTLRHWDFDDSQWSDRYQYWHHHMHHLVPPPSYPTSTTTCAAAAAVASLLPSSARARGSSERKGVAGEWIKQPYQLLAHDFTIQCMSPKDHEYPPRDMFPGIIVGTRCDTKSQVPPINTSSMLRFTTHWCCNGVFYRWMNHVCARYHSSMVCHIPYVVRVITLVSRVCLPWLCVTIANVSHDQLSYHMTRSHPPLHHHHQRHHAVMYNNIQQLQYPIIQHCLIHISNIVSVNPFHLWSAHVHSEASAISHKDSDTLMPSFNYMIPDANWLWLNLIDHHDQGLCTSAREYFVKITGHLWQYTAAVVHVDRAYRIRNS